MALEALRPGRDRPGPRAGAGGRRHHRPGAALGDVGRLPAVFRAALGLAAGRGGGRAVPVAACVRAGEGGAPPGPSHPDLFLLCSSAESARFAGMVGVGMVFAELNARADGAPARGCLPRGVPALGSSRSAPFAAVATIALAADTAEEAERLTALTPRPPPRPGEPPEGQGFIRRFRGDAAATCAWLAEKAEPHRRRRTLRAERRPDARVADPLAGADRRRDAASPPLPRGRRG